jgi:pimeloyl-ACP methyl ester carboxylesterase
MAIAVVGRVRLSYELTGAGRIPVVLVHGSWVSRRSWDAAVPGLAQSFRVLSFDRRGHSESERPAAQGSVREDVADLAALIEQLALAPAFVAGNSFGGSIALRLAGERPDLVLGVAAHEPPLFRLLAGDPGRAPVLEEIGRRVGAVVERIASGDHAGAAEQFAETVALGPGSWSQLPPETQRTMIENAPTFLDETRDPEALGIDLDALRGLDRPVLLTLGDQSPPTFAPVVELLAKALPRAEVVRFAGAGHIPHTTHPALYVEAVTAFVRKRVTNAA